MKILLASLRYNLFYVSLGSLYSIYDLGLVISYYICFSGIFFCYVDIDRYSMDQISGLSLKFVFVKQLLVSGEFTFFFWGGRGVHPAPCRSVPERHHLPLVVFLNKDAVLFYDRLILHLSLFYTGHLVCIIVFNYDYLNSTATLLCLCFNSYTFTIIIICTYAFHFILHTTLMKKLQISKYIRQ